MGKLNGGGLILLGVVLIVAGAFLRWDLIDWLIDVMGFLLILTGAGLGIAGIVKLFSGGQTESA